MSTFNTANVETFARWPEVLAIAGITNKKTIRAWVRQKKFPAPLDYPSPEWRWSRAAVLAWRAKLENVPA